MSKSMKPKAKVTISAEDKGNQLAKIADKAIRNQKYHDKLTKKTYENDTRRPERGPNDIKWRTESKLVVSAANIPFGFPLGLEIDTTEYSPGNIIGLDGYSKTMVTPGIMAIAMQITGGKSTDYNSPLNLAIRKSYSWIRHANSGSKNYEAADLGMYYIAVGQALALLGWLKRLYVHALNYSATNRYLPRGVILINDVNLRDLTDNLPNLLFLINWLSSTINSLAFPKFHYFTMCHEQFMHVYKDSESPKEQFYLYVPYTFGIYNPTLTANGGGVDYSTAMPAMATFAQISAYVHNVMDVLLGDEDIGIISGDILKAYGDDRFKVEPVEVKDIAEPLYSIEVLEQIHNCTVCGSLPLVRYEQDPGNTNSAPFIKEAFSGSPITVATSDFWVPGGDKVFIDAFGAVPTPDEVVNCSILKSHLDYSVVAGTGGTFTVTPTSVEHDVLLPCAVKLCVGVGAQPLVHTVSMGASSEWYISSNQGLPIDYMKLTNFDWAPMLKYWDLQDEMASFIGDVHNLTVLSSQQLARIHEAATLSLFNFESGNF